MKLTRPSLLIDKEKCLQNIQRISGKAEKFRTSSRPHFKTHQSAEIGRWYRDFGVTGCTVSSVSMADYFVTNGWNDITIACPYNPLESEDISRIAQYAQLNILIPSEESLQLAKEKLTSPMGFFIKVDVGTHRTGLDPKNESVIEELIMESNEKLAFKGFLAHAGHTYQCRHQQQIAAIYHECISLLLPLKNSFGGIISWGDTPTCSVIEDFSKVDELRAGNFIFYDWMQKQISSCEMDDIAVCMACPVTAIHPERNEVVVYGGSVHLSKDFIE